MLGGRQGPLRTVGAGYRLDLDEDQADLIRFRALVRSSRRARPEAAEQALDEAVSLWRGPALADLAGEPFHARVAEGLEDERARAVEARAEAALGVGRAPAFVLDRLRALRDSHPLRESTAALTMWAQVASGSPSEALQTYEEVRRALREQLGVDPSSVLREMHGRVLRSDPTLDAARAEEPLPAPPTSVGWADPLYGRDEDVVQVIGLLDERGLVTLTGPGGAGKTRLAVEVLNRSTAIGGAGWFVDLAPVRDEVLIASTVASAVGAQASAGTDPVAALIARMASAEGLLVLDNLEHLATVADLVAHLRPTCPRVRLLVTSRQGLGIAGERQYPVPLLAVPDERGPGRRRSCPRDDRRGTAPGRPRDGGRSDVPRDGRQRRSRRHDRAAPRRTPAAIEIAAPWLRLLTPEALVERVSAAGLDLAAARNDLPERQRTLRSTIDWATTC